MSYRDPIRALTMVWVLLALVSCAGADGQDTSDARVNVAILVMDGAYITEFAGPLDVYHHVPEDQLNVYLVSDTDKLIHSYEGMPFRPNYSVDNAPQPDVLVVTSGTGSLGTDAENERVIGWIRTAAEGADYVTSHCQGAFLLGAAGLLDNRDATTFPDNQDQLQEEYAFCRVQKGQRVVIDGNLVTTPGGLASYEGALYIVRELFGETRANMVANALIFGSSNEAASRVGGEGL